MADFLNKQICNVVLPDWIAEVEEAAGRHHTGERRLKLSEAGELFIEHADDLCLKIRQLMVDIATRDREIAELRAPLEFTCPSCGAKLLIATGGSVADDTAGE